MSIHVRPKVVTLKKNTEIKDLLDNGKKIYTKYGIFFLSQEKSLSVFSFAVLIKKSVGNAVWRNYCKRIVRVYIREHISKFLVFKRIVFLYNFQGKVKFDELTQEFDKRLKIWWKPFYYLLLKFTKDWFLPCFHHIVGFILPVRNMPINRSIIMGWSKEYGSAWSESENAIRFMRAALIL
jgi:ribonuclease P protein component